MFATGSGACASLELVEVVEAVEVLADVSSLNVVVSLVSSSLDGTFVGGNVGSFVGTNECWTRQWTRRWVPCYFLVIPRVHVYSTRFNGNLQIYTLFCLINRFKPLLKSFFISIADDTSASQYIYICCELLIFKLLILHFLFSDIDV